MNGVMCTAIKTLLCKLLSHRDRESNFGMPPIETNETSHTMSYAMSHTMRVKGTYDVLHQTYDVAYDVHPTM